MPFCPISIHPPRGGRDWCRVMEPPASTAFQSTLPVWGGTMMAMLDHGIDGFQSTLPVRGGTLQGLRHGLVQHFNPPSPYGEGLLGGWCQLAHIIYFNPPSPRGEGQSPAEKRVAALIFQSTFPVWGGTSVLRHLFLFCAISIHPPRGGRDTSRSCAYTARYVFQSTLPVGGGTKWRWSLPAFTGFQSTLPVRGGTPGD